MPSWAEILEEMKGTLPITVHPVNAVRKKYLAKLQNNTGRNVIAYYSAWLQGQPNQRLSIIDDMDKNAFMATIHELDTTKGLDLILHTPGGEISATESIVSYLKEKFNTDIRVIIPQMAMSAGTMIACSGKEIVMGKQSSMGP